MQTLLPLLLLCRHWAVAECCSVLPLISFRGSTFITTCHNPMICPWQVASLWWCFLLRNFNPASATECNKLNVHIFSRPSNPPCWVSPWAPVARAQVAFLPTSADVCYGSLPLRHILWCELRRKFLSWRLRMLLYIRSMLTPMLAWQGYFWKHLPITTKPGGDLPMACDSLDGTTGTVMYLQGWQPVSTINHQTIRKYWSIHAGTHIYIYIYIYLQNAFVASNCAVEREAWVLF